jgi:glycosyltransferase involved in cell wall biosynthesis
MKIAFVSQPFDEVRARKRNSIGAWTYEVARRLAPTCDVIVYLKGKRTIPAEVRDEGVLYRSVSLRYDRLLLKAVNRIFRSDRVNKSVFSWGLYYVIYILWVAIDLRSRHCDIVHIHNFSQYVSVIRAFNPGIKIVLHMHCEWLTQLESDIVSKRLEQVDSIFGCSQYITEKIQHAFPRFAERCHAIHNAVDVDRFKPSGNLAVDGVQRPTRLLFVGRVSPEKGVHVLLEAFADVVDHYPEAELEVVGGRVQLPFDFLINLSRERRIQELERFYNRDSRYSYSRYLVQRIESRGIEDKVVFTGSIEQSRTVDCYRRADIFVYPSIWDEPFGIPPIEAMAVGVPVIASRTGGIVESVQEGLTGLLVEPDDSQTLKRAILSLLGDERRRLAMGRLGRIRAVERFSYTVLIERLLGIYEASLQFKKVTESVG